MISASPAGGKVSRAQMDTAARAIFDAWAEIEPGKTCTFDEATAQSQEYLRLAAIVAFKSLGLEIEGDEK